MGDSDSRILAGPANMLVLLGGAPTNTELKARPSSSFLSNPQESPGSPQIPPNLSAAARESVLGKKNATPQGIWGDPGRSTRRAVFPNDHSDALRIAFLEALATCGSVPDAARAVGLPVATPRRWARTDEGFAGLLDEAKAQGERVLLDAIDREIDRRAIEGFEDPIYQGGRLIGKIRRYSDLLLMFRAKRLDPAYRDRPPDNTINAGNVQIVVGSFTSPAPALPAPPPALPEAEP